MSKTIRSVLRSSLLVFAVAVFLPPAQAFYPNGFFNESGQLVIVKWPLSAMDRNHDGDVSGPDEGVILNFETGNGDNGFTTSEVAKVFAGFEEWERVSTAYIAFTQGPNIVEPVELEQGTDIIDAFNAVVFESDQDVIDQGGSLIGGAIAVALPTFVFEDTQVTIGNTTFPVTGGQIIDCDWIFGQVNRDVENSSDEFTFKGSAVITSGLGIGLGYSPLTNIDENATEQQLINVEDRVVAIRNFDGTIGLRGVTSTMLNDFIVYLEENGSRTDSHQDLAPDDIAHITFLYSRTDVDIFYDINQRARTQARNGFASEPIAGAWIRAWCDADNNPGTARVPFVDTLTGLYEWETNTAFRGNFKLKGLFKQLETIGEVAFTPTYTVTCSEFLPIVMGADERPIYDSTHPGETGFGFDSLFPTEVFAEGDNLVGLQNTNQGTPLTFDLDRRKVVSSTSGKTLDVLLATGRPMFGDQSAVCPLNVIVGPETAQAAIFLRGFRDKVLFDSAAGTALADAYYRAAPTMANYLVAHQRALAAARVAIGGFTWILLHAEWLLAVTGVLLALGVATTLRRFRRARSLAAVALVAGGAALALSPSAGALLYPYDISDYVCMSTDIIQGKVTSVESYWTDDHLRIVTDVTVRVETVVKGQQNKDGLVHFQLPTGRVGAVGRFSADIPTFERGEEILLFLECQPRGFIIMGGSAGKYLIKKDPRTGEKYVLPTCLAGKSRLEKEVKKMREESAAKDGDTVTAKNEAPAPSVARLDDFIAHLRQVDRDQKHVDRQAKLQSTAK